jgi:hypothetical protein
MLRVVTGGRPLTLAAFGRFHREVEIGDHRALVEPGLIVEVSLMDAIDLLDVPGGDLAEQGVEGIAGGEAVQAQGPGQGGLARQGAIDVADAGDARDADRHQGHQLVHRLEVGVGGGGDRHPLEP